MELQKLFETFEHTAFRLEGLPNYAVSIEDDAYDQFIRDGSIAADFNEPWVQLLRQAKERNAHFERLRLVSDPLSTYEQFEMKAYKKSMKAGEDIRVMDRIDWPFTGDFWFFDKKWIARMHYDADGVPVATDVHEADEDELADLAYWTDIFASAPKVPEIFSLDEE